MADLPRPIVVDTDAIVAKVKEWVEKEFTGEIERLREDRQESDDLRGRLAALLTGVANALKGRRPGMLHDWSDLPEVAAAAVADRDAALARLTAVEAVLADGRVTYSINNADDPEVRAGRDTVRVLTPMMTETDAVRAALAGRKSDDRADA